MRSATKIIVGVFAAGLVLSAITGASEGGEEEATQDMQVTTAVRETPAPVLDPKGVNPLPVSEPRNRVTSKHLAVVCPRLLDLERAVNLHNARRTDNVLAMGCRYLREGEQGVRVSQAGSMQEIMFDTRGGSAVYWGYVTHFVWEP